MVLSGWNEQVSLSGIVRSEDLSSSDNKSLVEINSGGSVFFLFFQEKGSPSTEKVS